jgi:hypothetical protein
VGKKRKSWYGVKSLYRFEAHGEPTDADDDYDPDATLIEERVVLVHARGARKAIEKGRQEADRYDATFVYPNRYDQPVTVRRIRVLQIWPVGRPGVNREVWSATEVVPATITDKEMEDRRFGGDETKATRRRRKKFYLRRD